LSLTKSKSSEEVRDNIRIIQRHANFVVSNTPIRWFFFWEIKKIIQKNKIDIVNAHTPVPFAVDMAAGACWLTKIPLVVTYHSASLLKNNFYFDLLVKYYQLIEGFSLKIAKKIVVVAPHILKQERMKKNSAKAVIIYPGVDVSIFQKSVYPANQQLLFIAPLSSAYPAKGLDVLLKALVAVKKNIPDVKLNIAGEKGDAFLNFHHLVNELGISNNVNFLGKLESKQIIEQYVKCSILVVPSINNTEGTPTVLFEAAASGRPVIGSNVAGIPYIIVNKKSGLLFPPGDSQQLAEQIIFLLANKEIAKNMSDFTFNNSKQFSWNNRTEQYVKLFQEIIS
jgi:glycosyltransferase involved in cell wall biosynthesis